MMTVALMLAVTRDAISTAHMGRPEPLLIGRRF